MIDIKSPALKEESSSAYILIFESDNEKGKGPLKPLKVFYHKENVKYMDNEIYLFSCESIEIPHWNSNVITHTSRSKAEVRDKSKKVASDNGDKGKEF